MSVLCPPCYDFSIAYSSRAGTMSGVSVLSPDVPMVFFVTIIVCVAFHPSEQSESRECRVITASLHRIKLVADICALYRYGEAFLSPIKNSLIPWKHGSIWLAGQGCNGAILGNEGLRRSSSVNALIGPWRKGARGWDALSKTTSAFNRYTTAALPSTA